MKYDVNVSSALPRFTSSAFSSFTSSALLSFTKTSEINSNPRTAFHGPQPILMACVSRTLRVDARATRGRFPVPHSISVLRNDDVESFSVEMKSHVTIFQNTCMTH